MDNHSKCIICPWGSSQNQQIKVYYQMYLAGKFFIYSRIDEVFIMIWGRSLRIARIIEIG